MAQDDKSQGPPKLFNMPLGTLEPDEINFAYLEQYKLYIEAHNKLTDRRQKVNSYFLTINTVLFSVLAFLCSKDTDPNIKPLHVLIPISGIFISFFWQLTIRSYRNLSNAKFIVIRQVELYLPLSLYQMEWYLLGEGKDKNKYWLLTKTEILIPRLFFLLYLLIVMYLFFK